MIIWLASYPKSGNTWLRSLLSAYYYSKNGNFNFELLKNIDVYPQQKYFDVKIDKPGEINSYWDISQEKIISEKKIKILKTHNSLLELNGKNFTKPQYTLGIIYIVRDPRNVITSLKNHYDLDYEQSLDFMLNEKKYIYDIREKNADIGVLVTAVMPKGVTKPILMDGIWVCSLNDYEFIIECLRQNLIELRKVMVINENALDKQALVYQFVTSKEFARIMEALYEHFLEEEKSINYDDRLWQQSLNKRRKRLEMDNKLVGQLVGAFQSYCGDSISEIKSLEMSEVE